MYTFWARVTNDRGSWSHVLEQPISVRTETRINYANCTDNRQNNCVFIKIEKRHLLVRPMGGWNSTLQAAWYARHAHRARLCYVPFAIWCLWTKSTIWSLILSSTSFIFCKMWASLTRIILTIHGLEYTVVYDGDVDIHVPHTGSTRFQAILLIIPDFWPSRLCSWVNRRGVH